jgi:HPt (histidine-containing phosphotransfer) domain-containing protein
MPDVIYVDVEEGSKRVMNNTKLYVRLLTKFKDDHNLKDLEAALAAGEMEKAQAFAHTIKGLAGNLSLTELFKQSLELETQIKAKNVNPEQLALVKSVYAQTLTEADKVISQYG